MTGAELRDILKRGGFELSSIAEKLKMSPQAFNSKLKSMDISVGFLKSIASAINKSVYELMDEKIAPNLAPNLAPKRKKGEKLGAGKMEVNFGGNEKSKYTTLLEKHLELIESLIAVKDEIRSLRDELKANLNVEHDTIIAGLTRLAAVQSVLSEHIAKVNKTTVDKVSANIRIKENEIRKAASPIGNVAETSS
jgi:transcriptional regulator with XRE-family HTH domain